MANQPDYILLIHKYLSGDVTEAEADLLNTWKLENEQNRELFEEITQAWEFSGHYWQDSSLDREKELERLLERIDRHVESISGRQPFARRLISTSYFRYAASLLLVISCLYFGYHLTTRSDGSNDETVATMANIKQVYLPDSSLAHLNRNSALQLRDDFRQRTIHLTGEAFFDVKPDAGRPFTIHTAHATIRVVGTSFNVRAVEDEEQVVVTVTSGIVEVTTDEAKETIYPGDKCVVHNENGVIDKAVNTDPNFLSWKTKKLRYEKARLENVFKDMERQYGITIDIENKNLLDCRFNGSFDNIRLDDALEIISFSLGIKARKVDSNTIIITGNGCNHKTQ